MEFDYSMVPLVERSIIVKHIFGQFSCTTAIEVDPDQVGHVVNSTPDTQKNATVTDNTEEHQRKGTTQNGE